MGSRPVERKKKMHGMIILISSLGVLLLISRDKSCYYTEPIAILFPEATILLVSDGNRDLWPGPTLEVRDSWTSVTLRMPRVKSDKSDWLWSQSIVFTNPFKTGMSLDLARGRDSWC